MRLVDADSLKDDICKKCYSNDCKSDATDTITGCYLLETINNAPTVEAEPVRHTTNISKIADCDEFICNDCGLHLKDWVRVEITDEYGEDHYEYEFEFCPSCGAKIIEDMDIKPAEQFGFAPAT